MIIFAIRVNNEIIRAICLIKFHNNDLFDMIQRNKII